MVVTAEPRVSVLVPVYNAAATIAEAVTSALAQTVAELEVIVVDDGSTEPVAAPLSEIHDERVRIVRRADNAGVSAARNSALALARAPLIAQLDADDSWQADHLEHLLPAFDDPAIGLAYANVKIVGFPASDRWIAARAPDDRLPEWICDRADQPVNDLRLLYRANPIPAPAVVMRTDAVRAVGGYPEWLKVGEEYLLYIRLRRAGWRFAYVDRRSATYRWPEPGRGVTFDVKRNARQQAKLFAMLAITSPPNAAIFTRLGRELLELVKVYVPALAVFGRHLRAYMSRARRAGARPARPS
jgi:glycosyltransferase involved in cell wall biosynthesis